MSIRALKQVFLHSGWCLAAVVALAVLTYAHALPHLVHMWLNSPEYSHGLIIPLVVVYIVWEARGRIFDRQFQLSWLGVAAVFFAQLVFVAATLADLETAKYYSLITTLAAVLWTFGHWRLLRKCLFPLALLFFAIPLPYLLNELLTARMQLVSSDIGVALIRLMGLPVLQEGNVIDMGEFKLLVAEACSGLRYMFPLISVALIVAYFFKAPLWARIVVVLSAVPITVFMNSFRIAVTGALIKEFGSASAEGFLHAFEGWVVFIAALVLLLLGVWLITLTLPRQAEFIDHFHFDSRVKIASFSRWQKVPAPVLALAALLFSSALTTSYLSYGFNSIIPVRSSFTRFPFVIAERSLFPDSLSQEVLDVLRADDYFIGDYKGDQLLPINLYMAYYAQQKDGSALHSPRSCIPGGGWQIKSLEQVDLPNMPGWGNRVIIEKGREKLLVYYWIHQQGNNYANEFRARASLLLSSLGDRRTDGALVRVIAPVVDGDSAAAEQQIRAFIADLSEQLPNFLPN